MKRDGKKLAIRDVVTRSRPNEGAICEKNSELKDILNAFLSKLVFIFRNNF